MARRRLGFSVDEWLSLPWWQRRVYIEGMNNEAQDNQADAPPGGMDPFEAVLAGEIDDVAAAGFST